MKNLILVLACALIITAGTSAVTELMEVRNTKGMEDIYKPDYGFTDYSTAKRSVFKNTTAAKKTTGKLYYTADNGNNGGNSSPELAYASTHSSLLSFEHTANKSNRINPDRLGENMQVFASAMDRKKHAAAYTGNVGSLNNAIGGINGNTSKSNSNGGATAYRGVSASNVYTMGTQGNGLSGQMVPFGMPLALADVGVGPGDGEDEEELPPNPLPISNGMAALIIMTAAYVIKKRR